MQIEVSIVTVCFNSEKTIRKCIQSVLELEYGNYEYLIIDGASKDSTVDIASSFNDKFCDKKIPYTIISEKDGGIYNAMNKAADLAKGKWIVFLNSDDYFYSSDSLNINFDTEIDVIYGDVIVKTGEKEVLQKPRNIDRLKSGTEMPFCHQSTFTKSDILKKYKFDEQYKIIADIDSFLRMYEDGLKFAYIEKTISVFSNEGTSQTHRIESMAEGKKLLIAHNCYSIKKFFELNSRILWYWLKQIIKTD